MFTDNLGVGCGGGVCGGGGGGGQGFIQDFLKTIWRPHLPGNSAHSWFHLGISSWGQSSWRGEGSLHNYHYLGGGGGGGGEVELFGGGGEASLAPPPLMKPCHYQTNVLTARIHLWKNSRCF